MLWLLYLCITDLWEFTLAETVGFVRSVDRVSFVCPAYKASRVGDNQSEFASCVEFKAVSGHQNLTFQLEVGESLPYKMDVTRFGPKSSENGKQSLDFSLTDNYGNLVQGHRHLALGKSVIQVRTGERPCTLTLCFINLVYDGSWRSLDVNKIVTVTVFNSSDSHVGPENIITDQDYALLVESHDIIRCFSNVNFGQELLAIEVTIETSTKAPSSGLPTAKWQLWS